MAENEEFSSESEDEDYVPSGEENDVNSEDSVDDNETLNDEEEKTKGKKRKIGNNKTTRRKRRSGLRVNKDHESSDCSDDDTKELNEGKKELTEEEEKARSDSLWCDFLKDTKQTSKISEINKSNSKPKVENKPIEPKEVTKIFSFAGEEVKIKEAVNSNKDSNKVAKEIEEKPIPQPSPSFTGVKSSSNLGSILGKISGKAPKLSTLEKSKLDWKEYKSEEGIEEELHSHNKGKDGYLERQAFLQRADLRQFEIERNLRMSNRR